MLGRRERSGLHLFFLGASPAQNGRGRQSTMPATRHEFSDATLTELLRALRARTSRHPDNPGLIASGRGCAKTGWRQPATSCSTAAIRCSGCRSRAPSPAGAARAGRSAPRARSRRSRRPQPWPRRRQSRGRHRPAHSAHASGSPGALLRSDTDRPRSRSRLPRGCVASSRWARVGVEPLSGRDCWLQGQPRLHPTLNRVGASKVRYSFRRIRARARTDRRGAPGLRPRGA
jgi:hypothetical protein